MAAKAIAVQSEDGFNLPPLNQEDGSSFGWFERLVFGIRDGLVTDYADWEARDLYQMMEKDYKARQLELVLTLPITSATHSNIAAKGDKGELEWLNNFWDLDHLNGGCKVPLNHVVQQMTTAATYKRAYFEKVWTEGKGDFAGKTVYKNLAWRPQTTCRLMRTPHHGDFMGFEQEAFYVGAEITKGKWPIQIQKDRAYVYMHGLRRDPLNGTSDMEVTYWAYKTKQKILFLWMQFLESIALPRTVVMANDQGVANQIAGQIAKLKSSGILPVANPGNAEAVNISTLDISGKGAEQFTTAITWLDSCATNSVLAGFLDLTSRAANPTGNHGGGSFALSKDASDFFLQTREGMCREMEFSIRKDLFAPLIRYNFGPDAKVPHFKFEPLVDIDKATSVDLFEKIASAPALPPAIPSEFVGMLAQQVAEYTGMDGQVVRKAFDAQAVKAQAAAAAMGPAGASPTGQAVAGAAGVAGAAESTLAVRGGPNTQAPSPQDVAKVRAMFEK